MRKGCDRGGCSCGHEDVVAAKRMVKCGGGGDGGAVVCRHNVWWCGLWH